MQVRHKGSCVKCSKVESVHDSWGAFFDPLDLNLLKINHGPEFHRFKPTPVSQRKAYSVDGGTICLGVNQSFREIHS